MRRTIDNVLPEIDEWQSKYGDFMYSVVAFFTNKEMVRANKKSKDAALELQGLLMETAQIPQDFVLESAGVSKAGNPKWKLLAFGPEGGPYTYSTLKDGQNVGSGASVVPESRPGTGAEPAGEVGRVRTAESPGKTRLSGQSPHSDTEASIRAAVALKAAVEACPGEGGELNLSAVLAAAEIFDAWLAKKSGADGTSSASAASSPLDAPAPDSSSGPPVPRPGVAGRDEGDVTTESPMARLGPDASSGGSGDGEAPGSPDTTYQDRWAKKFGTTE